MISLLPWSYLSYLYVGVCTPSSRLFGAALFQFHSFVFTLLCLRLSDIIAGSFGIVWWYVSSGQCQQIFTHFFHCHLVSSSPYFTVLAGVAVILCFDGQVDTGLVGRFLRVPASSELWQSHISNQVIHGPCVRLTALWSIQSWTSKVWQWASPPLPCKTLVCWIQWNVVGNSPCYSRALNPIQYMPACYRLNQSQPA